MFSIDALKVSVCEPSADINDTNDASDVSLFRAGSRLPDSKDQRSEGHASVAFNDHFGGIIVVTEARLVERVGASGRNADRDWAD